MVFRKDLFFEINKYAYNFQQFESIRNFCESIYEGKIASSDADKEVIEF